MPSEAGRLDAIEAIPVNDVCNHDRARRAADIDSVTCVAIVSVPRDHRLVTIRKNAAERGIFIVVRAIQ